MDDTLLSYYNRELAYLRGLGAEFAEAHPKIAGRLRIGNDMVEDPHVSRLIESFAFLTARIRQKLDDGFPELTEALMGLLYPDYNAPVPSMSIARFQPRPDRPEAHHIPAGTALHTESNPLGVCRFRTCFATAALPLQITHARFAAQPFATPALPDSAKGAHALLEIHIAPLGGASLTDVGAGRLRFFLNGQPQLTFRLYEYLLSHATGITVAAGTDDERPTHLTPDQLTPVGFDAGHGVLPLDGRCSSAHRLLAEYFAFPEKFLFVDLNGLDRAWPEAAQSARIYIFMDRSHAELVQGVTADTLMFGATPIVNLFEHPIEPFTAEEMAYEQRLTIDATGREPADIHTLLNVYARNSDGARIELMPFYGGHRAPDPERPAPYWHARREISRWFNGRPSHGTDTYLSFVDDTDRLAAPNGDWVLYGDALCTNRDVPDQLPFGPGEPQLHVTSGDSGLTVQCLSPATPTIQPRLGDATRWQLVTQLSLQDFTGTDGLRTLKDTLRLYDFRQTPENAAVIDGIAALRAEPATARVTQGGRAAVCQGTHLLVEVDEHRYSGSGLYLFSAVLSEFFAQHCALNTFVRLTVRSRQNPGRIIEWPAKSGSQTLL